MSNYGRFFSGPGSANFAGWPSKQAGMPSGPGRYNAPSAGEGVPWMPELPQALAALPQNNYDSTGRNLLPNGPLSVAGSRYAKSASYYDHGEGLHSLDVHLHDGRRQEYGAVPFALIYLLSKAPDPGWVYDNFIHDQFNSCISGPSSTRR